MPTDNQALLVEAIKDLGAGFKKQAEAALAPLQANAAVSRQPSQGGRVKCFRCGGMGHARKECAAVGVIDADCAGEIMIMVFTLYPPVQIQQGQKLAQLIPLPQFTRTIQPRNQDPRGEKGFGSTGGHN
uniref:CCHC-type domain-containing protein n=1 Tax=Ficedula albicollis TaxID=59894 RepID=A0A803VRA0_FICAL